MSEQFKMTAEEILEANADYGTDMFMQILGRHEGRLMAFRATAVGDRAISQDGVVYTSDGVTGYKRFILRPRKKITVMDCVFKNTGKPHKATQWYRNHAGEMLIGWVSLDGYEGYTRELATREIEVEG